jgi:photosystem II stability/assembly factor-like uncharacterized protein
MDAALTAVKPFVTLGRNPTSGGYMFKRIAGAAVAGVALLTACTGGGGSGPSQTPSWRSVASPTNRDINAVSRAADNDVWACGDAGTVLRWDGTEWRLTITSIAPDCYDLDMISSTAGWMCGGEGFVARYDGQGWVPYPQSLKVVNLYGLCVIDTTEVWACGERGTILHYKWGGWEDKSPAISDDLYAIRVNADGSGWAVGDNGRILKREADGNWTAVTSPIGADYRCAFFLNDAEGYFGATNGYIVHLKDGGFSKSRLPSTGTVLGLHLRLDGRGYAVTKAGHIYIRATDGGWRQWFYAGDQLNDIVFHQGEHGFAVGERGVIYAH